MVTFSIQLKYNYRCLLIHLTIATLVKKSIKLQNCSGRNTLINNLGYQMQYLFLILLLFKMHILFLEYTEHNITFLYVEAFVAIKYKLLLTYLGQYCTQIVPINPNR